MSDTPRTDAAAGHATGILDRAIMEHARTLERELTEAQALLAASEADAANLRRKWTAEILRRLQVARERDDALASLM